jgi:hypothetical protein
MNPKSKSLQARMLLHFYSGYLPASLLITICCDMLYARWSTGITGVLIIFKLATDLLVLWLVNEYQSRRYYYYHNLGLSKRSLWSITLTADFAVFLLTIILIGSW